MTRLFYYILFSILIWTFQACTPTPPSEVDILSKIVGTYCSNGETDYRFILTDSTYYSIRRTPGVLQTVTKVRESCRGDFSLRYEAGYWYIDFEADPDPEAVLDNCGRSYKVWGEKEGYLVGEEVVTLQELFDQHPVTQAACDEF